MFWVSWAEYVKSRPEQIIKDILRKIHYKKQYL